MAEHYVYKYVKDGEVIYIGKTDANLKHRIDCHSREPKFLPHLPCDIFYTKLENAAQTCGLECLLIDLYQPVLNVRSKYSRQCVVVQDTYEWELYAQDGYCEKTKNAETSVRSENKTIDRSTHGNDRMVRRINQLRVHVEFAEAEIELWQSVRDFFDDDKDWSCEHDFVCETKRLGPLMEFLTFPASVILADSAEIVLKEFFVFDSFKVCERPDGSRYVCGHYANMLDHAKSEEIINGMYPVYDLPLNTTVRDLVLRSWELKNQSLCDRYIHLLEELRHEEEML